MTAEAGARFLVSPVMDEAVIHAANDLGVASMPGTHTPTEMLRAHRAVGFVAPLFVADDIATGRWDAIEERARQCLAAVQGN